MSADTEYPYTSKQSRKCQILFDELKEKHAIMDAKYAEAVAHARATGNVEALKKYGKLEWDYKLRKSRKDFNNAETEWEQAGCDRENRAAGIREWHDYLEKFSRSTLTADQIEAYLHPERAHKIHKAIREQKEE